MEAKDIKKIIELPKNVADKIAAGEVVDRPVSIVKELVENSIDAGADSVIIEIKNGGKSYIRVTDNGSGIDKEDVELAFKRHATSKIRTDSDLDHIGSLGFRGEALASIAAVSRVELITKTRTAKSGIRIKIDGGEFLEKADIGAPEGTTIIVEDLFFNTPARLKFMKQDATESTLIIDLISKMTLAYPNIKMRLINNGNILFSTPGKGDIYSNILTIYSREIGDKLIHFQEGAVQMYLEGFISSPDNSKTNRKSQIFFVNGRYINSKIIENAVTEAYKEKLFEGRFPIAFLFLYVSPEKLDVNIHPNKREVRFDNELLVKGFLVEAIRKGLNQKEAIPEIKKKDIFKRTAEDIGLIQRKASQVDIKSLLYQERHPEEKTYTEEAQIIESIRQDSSIAEAAEAYGLIEKLSEFSKAPNLAGHSNHQADKTAAGTISTSHEFDMGSLTLTGSIFGTYLTAVDENSFYLIDQHAAHERIFYEQLLDQYSLEDKPQQLILTPLVINVTHAAQSAAEGIIDFLGNLGFEAEEFGPAAYIIKAVPVFMNLDEAKDFVDYIFDNISEDSELKNQKKRDAIITNACKKAVKANDVLDKKEIERLMADLAKTKNPYSCPHGRPTFVRLKKYEIEKMFKRV